MPYGLALARMPPSLAVYKSGSSLFTSTATVSESNAFRTASIFFPPEFEGTAVSVHLSSCLYVHAFWIVHSGPLPFMWLKETETPGQGWTHSRVTHSPISIPALACTSGPHSVHLTQRPSCLPLAPVPYGIRPGS